MRYPIDLKTGRWLSQDAALQQAKQSGITARPSPPRNIQVRSGSRKVAVYWDAPDRNDHIIGYKIYTGNENSLFATINDPNVRQYDVPASSGSTPPNKNIFISCFSVNNESTRIQVIGTALAEAGAPTDPAPPSGSAASGDTGTSTVGAPTNTNNTGSNKLGGL